MKKGMITLGILFFVLFNPSQVMASNINPYEAELIEIAKGRFEYKGNYYVVTKAYIQEVINYVSQEDVDINAQQRDEIVQAVYNNIKEGISDGYMVLEDGSIEDTNPEDNPKVNSNTDDKSVQDVEGSQRPSNVSENLESILDPIVKDKPEVVVDNEKSEVRVTSEDNTNLITVNTVIKNTGFSLYNSVLITGGLGIVMLLCVGVAMKFQLFAYEDES